MDLTRRQFTSLLGLLALGGATSAHAASEAKADKKAAGKSAPPEPPKKAATPEQEIWDDLMQGNKRFVAGEPQARTFVPTREELAKGQKPKVIVLGCSDSRVSPTLVFDKSLGDLFVIRTAGNIADPIALGSIEYAVEHIHAPVLVVLGHEKCGAVAAAAAGEKMPTRNLKAIVKRIAPALAPFKARAKGDELVALGVPANVLQSARYLVEKSPIIKEAVEGKKLTIVRAVYKLGTGEVTRLPDAPAAS